MFVEIKWDVLHMLGLGPDRTRYPKCASHCSQDGKCPVGVITAMKEKQLQHRGKYIWAAGLGQDIAAQLENLLVKVYQMDL